MPESKKTSSGDPSPTPPTRSSLDLYREAKREERRAVTEKTIAFVRARIRYGGIGGNDKTEDMDVLAESLDELVQAFPQGIPLPYAKVGFDDMKLFQKMREKLVKAGRMKEENRGAASYLVPIPKKEEVTA